MNNKHYLYTCTLQPSVITQNNAYKIQIHSRNELSLVAKSLVRVVCSALSFFFCVVLDFIVALVDFCYVYHRSKCWNRLFWYIQFIVVTCSVVVCMTMIWLMMSLIVSGLVVGMSQSTLTYSVNPCEFCERYTCMSLSSSSS